MPTEPEAYERETSKKEEDGKIAEQRSWGLQRL
jgi:hypothetical protein